MEQMLQAAAAGALGQPDGPPCAAAPWWGGPPLPAQQRQVSPARRPLHEPRPPVLAPTAGAKRRQVSVRPPSRWDYRPAWSEGHRVDDLPLSSRARQASTAAQPSSPQPQPGTTVPVQPQADGPAGCAPTLQQPAFHAQGVAPAAPTQPAQPHATVGLGPGQTLPPQPQMGGYQAVQGPPPPVFLPSSAAQFNSTCNPAVGQFCPGSPAAMPTPAQHQHHQQWQYGWPAAADPVSRPVTAGAQQWQVPHQQPAPSTAQLPHQVYAETPSWPCYGAPVVAQPVAPHQYVQQVHQPASAMPAHALQQQTQPATPGAGLGLGGPFYEASSSASTAWQPQAANSALNALNTPRPRSAAAKVCKTFEMSAL